MTVSLACALGTSLCYGAGSVLQAAAATRTARTARLDPRLLVRLSRTWRYSAGLGLDALGFLLSLVALRSLPLYVVQSVVASFLAVTAVLGVLFLGLRMRRREVAALVAVVLGLTLVGLSAAPQSPDLAGPIGSAVARLVLGAAVVLVLVSVALARTSGDVGAWVLGAAAGLAFGVVAVAVRALPSVATGGSPAGDVRAWLGEAATWPALVAVLLATPLALTAYATALQRGTVVQATAPLVVGETVLPALAGLSLLGDHPRPGWSAAAGFGFALAVGASLLLARFGEVDPSVTAAARAER